MRILQKIIIYLFFMFISTAFGIWFCSSDTFIPIQKFLFQFKLFSIFKGKREFIINLLLSLNISTGFATLGFYIDYIEKKKQQQEKLITFYVTIRNKCFDRILYQKNSYDNDYDEVDLIYNFLNEYKPIILDYRPLRLFLNVKVHHFFQKLKEKNK